MEEEKYTVMMPGGEGSFVVLMETFTSLCPFIVGPECPRSPGNKDTCNIYDNKNYLSCLDYHKIRKGIMGE